MPVVGYLSTLSEAQVAAQVAAFRRGTETPGSRRDEAFFGETQERIGLGLDAVSESDEERDAKSQA